MSAETGAVVAVRMPQVNVNDEEVVLAAWRVEDGGRAVEGKPLCDIETSKAVGELPSPATGVVRHAAKAGDAVKIDGIIAYIGPDAAVIDSYLSSLSKLSSTSPSPAPASAAAATAGAVELARSAGIDLSQVPAGEGRIRRSDVEKYLTNRPQGAGPIGPTASSDGLGLQPVTVDVLPAPLAEATEEVEPLANHAWAISRHLKETQDRLVVAHAMMDVNMQQAIEWMSRSRQAGLIASFLPILIKAAAAAIAACPKLVTFRLDRRMFKYRSLDIAFTARSQQGWLYTPVVREVDRLSLDQIAAHCSELAMAAFRGQLTDKDIAGGCLTVSLLSEQPVRMHVGLQNVYQTALVTSGAIRNEVHLVDGGPTAVSTVTLAMSYDHGVMDGWDAATALDAMRKTVENWTL